MSSPPGSESKRGGDLDLNLNLDRVIVHYLNQRLETLRFLTKHARSLGHFANSFVKPSVFVALGPNPRGKPSPVSGNETET